ncbi:flagellar biosynthesis protein FlhF [Clostridium sp. LY3-2]|uniref:flagellar biosynthesis protein FlhF n=1 Tax=Clostridium sp. LY3-2 TaxID=2942482 RepID=UPI00215325E6|nr:flagellar biosynthesis protein FlhF [Clostridium sp. LY3-2]MCR6513543.1 flagellar biosynthesis protein FlhF [Clostridium sp. LY3-2]
MLIKRYLVKNMNEALTRIRHELGKSAVIISQRKVRKKGILGFFEPKMIEVTAAVENSDSSKEDFKETKVEDSINSIKKVMEDTIKEKENTSFKSLVKENLEKNDIKLQKDDDELNKEINEMKNLLNTVIKNTTKEEKEDVILEILEELDIDKEFIPKILEKLEGIKEEDRIKKLKEIILSEIDLSTEDIKGNIVLVGPTGVGKTTTIAKLAGKLSLKENKKVGLITVDTYRIGAVEQLRTYAEIMNIPFKVVINTKDMEEAIEEMKDLDVVLIDSTGRSSKNVMQISELRALIEKTNADNINLVISATTKNKDIKAIVDGYNTLSYDKIIVTKLDETSSYGSIYNISKRANKPIRFLTIGQNVPDDIKDVSKESLEKIIFREVNIC